MVFVIFPARGYTPCGESGHLPFEASPVPHGSHTGRGLKQLVFAVVDLIGIKVDFVREIFYQLVELVNRFLERFNRLND